MHARHMTLLVALSLSCDATATYAEYCEHVCSCASCTADELSACKRFGRDWEKRAEDMDCDGELEELLGCVVANLHCDGGRLELAGDDACKEETAALPTACNPFAEQF